jgi:hypothetical protein
MVFTEKNIKIHRAKLLEKLKDYVQLSFGDRLTNVCLGLAIFALFPIMAVFYPSAMFLANTMLVLLVLIRIGEVCVLAYGMQLMEKMPTDIRKMQRTLMGSRTNISAHIIGMVAFVWTLVVCGFPVFAVLLTLLSIAAVVLTSKFYTLCETEAV